MTLWKVNCMEAWYPGMWHRWFRQQCVAVGWYSKWGYSIHGHTQDRAWSRVRNALEAITIGDYIVVALRDHRVGRIGQVTDKAVDDTDWEPLVPKSRHMPDGEMGRRIMVRWDLTVGPDDRDQVILLPEESRFSIGELRPALSEIRSVPLEKLRDAMNEPANWIGLLSHFRYESALSGYIAAYPHHLEDGLVPHPDNKVREKVFKDGSRSDVLLLDRDLRPVVVECKQGAPRIEDLAQLRKYMKHVEKESGQVARGILVHGGARKLSPEVQASAIATPCVEVVQHRLQVDYAPSM